jgi:uncharacterized protein (TIGR02996 family)
MARREDLEAKLVENPQDEALRLVYADLLQSTGDPRGPLIVMHEQDLLEEMSTYIDDHAEALLGPLARYKTAFDGSQEEAFYWHLGFIRYARFGYDSNTAGDVEVEDGPEIALEAGVAALLAHPSGMLLDDLKIAINMLDDGSYFQPVVEAIVASPRGIPTLRTLRLGEFSCSGGPGGEGDYEYEMSWTTLGDASALWAKLPRLESLVLQVGLGGSSAAGGADVIGTFELPKLKRLEVITGGMSEGCLRSFANARLPEATYIDLWLGSSDYGAGGSVADLAPLLAGTHVPKLVHLGLMNTEHSDAICAALPGSAILPRLTELSLAYGTMTDDGARALAANPAAIAHLVRLDVSQNWLTDAGLELLRAACDGVVGDEQKTGDADHRYVSLSE